MNYNPERHEELVEKEWDDSAVRSVIGDIFKDAQDTYCEDKFWPKNSGEEESSDKTIYYGAAGSLWGLNQISEFLSIPLTIDSHTAIEKIYNSYLSNPDTENVVPSLFLGEVGILLVKYQINPSKELEEKIFDLVEENISNPTLEALWAAPGTMIAASWFYNQTKKEMWKSLFVDNAAFLIEKLKEESEDNLIWEQDLYGKKVRYTGAGHGYFGNMYGILKNIELLDSADHDYILSHIETVISKLAIEDEGTVNWSPIYPAKPELKPLVQWCHGSPGIINSLKLYPKNSLHTEQLLVKAGELVWKAGPLTKGVGICHGTDGNGFALLQLYKRTGDERWLQRARKFAMHCLDQRSHKFTLFTGDIGFALYLIACIEKTDNFPFLDDF